MDAKWIPVPHTHWLGLIKNRALKYFTPIFVYYYELCVLDVK